MRNPLSKAKDRELLGTVRAEDQDPFDVTRPAWTGDERNKTWIILSVFLFQQRKCFRQVPQQLAAAGQDYVMRRKHRQGAATGAAAGDQNAAGLRHQRVALRDTHAAPLQLGHLVWYVRPANRQFQFAADDIGQFTGVGSKPRPALGIAP